MGDFPTPAVQQQDWGIHVWPTCQAGRMNGAEFRLSMEHKKQHRAAEGGHQIAEMAPTELPFAPNAEAQDPCILRKDVHIQHVSDDCFADFNWDCVCRVV